VLKNFADSSKGLIFAAKVGMKMCVQHKKVGMKMCVQHKKVGMKM